MADEAAGSPFRPGYNRRPPVLAGRDEVLAAADEAVAMAVTEALTPPALLLVGQRGVGKTVLLGEIADRAAQAYGWPRLHVEVTPSTPFTPDVVAAARELVASFDDPTPGGLRVREAVVGAGIGPVHGELTFSRDETPADDSAIRLRQALSAAVDAALRRDAGFVFTIDEMQLADRQELARLTAILQRGTDLDWPVVLVGAGLAGMRDPERAVSYFERAEWHEIGTLNHAETLQALQIPAANAGRPLDHDAAEILVEASGGYPYAVQLYGHHAWRASAGQTRINRKAAQRGVLSGGRQLDQGLYANRWAQASPGERNYLAALASILGSSPEVRGAQVAAELGVTTRQVGTVRDRLIKKGTLTSDGELLTFSVPGMADYVRRQVHRNHPAVAAEEHSADGHTDEVPDLEDGPGRFQPNWPRAQRSDELDLGL
ncbi:MAG: ATP-binding protein [Actinomycetota bacterium]|nr:ATP-binding protein [Actinomycetota bacterium]MDQ6948301.1 ATP-binding protein [Actinomycetota bacterium]